MRILAFHPGAHDASAAAFEDYRLLAAVQEERLTRQKGSGDGVPWLAIDEVLRIAGWTRRDVDAIASTRAFYPAGYVRGPLYKELDHALRHGSIAVVARSTAGGENHGVVRRLGGVG